MATGGTVMKHSKHSGTRRADQGRTAPQIEAARQILDFNQLRNGTRLRAPRFEGRRHRQGRKSLPASDHGNLRPYRLRGITFSSCSGGR